MTTYDLKITFPKRNRRLLETFASRIYDLIDFINYSVNSDDESIIFDCSIDGLYAIKELVKALPDENVNEFYGTCSFCLQFTCERYNEKYLPLLHSLIDKRNFDLNIKNISNQEIDDGRNIIIESCWKFNLESIVKLLPKEELKILNRRS